MLLPLGIKILEVSVLSKGRSIRKGVVAQILTQKESKPFSLFNLLFLLAPSNCLTFPCAWRLNDNVIKKIYM